MKPALWAVIAGIAIVLLDARVWSDPGVPMPFVVGVCFLLGLFYPSHPFRPALFLWSTIVLLEAGRMAAILAHIPAPLLFLGHRNPYPPSIPNLAVSIIPACASSLLGAWITRGIADSNGVPASE